MGVGAGRWIHVVAGIYGSSLFNHFKFLREVGSKSTTESECQEGCAGGLRRENRCAVAIYRE